MQIFLIAHVVFSSAVKAAKLRLTNAPAVLQLWHENKLTLAHDVKFKIHAQWNKRGGGAAVDGRRVVDVERRSSSGGEFEQD